MVTGNKIDQRLGHDSIVIVATVTPRTTRREVFDRGAPRPPLLTSAMVPPAEATPCALGATERDLIKTAALASRSTGWLPRRRSGPQRRSVLA